MLFRRIVVQYEKMWKRNAFIVMYKKEAPFAEGFGKFDEAKEVVMGLIGEYEAAEQGDAGEEGSEGARTMMLASQQSSHTIRWGIAC
jgi:tubulin gamma